MVICYLQQEASSFLQQDISFLQQDGSLRMRTRLLGRSGMYIHPSLTVTYLPVRSDSPEDERTKEKDFHRIS